MLLHLVILVLVICTFIFFKLFGFFYSRIMTSYSQCKGSIVLSVRRTVADKEKLMSDGDIALFGLVLFVSFSAQHCCLSARKGISHVENLFSEGFF